MSDETPHRIAARLRALTTARVGLGRTGVSQQLRDVLAFQQAHAMARDAVHAALDARRLAAEIESGNRQDVLRLHSAAANRAEYLQRPDLGRKLNEAGLALLAEQPGDEVDVALVIVDGLSALAVERHVPPLLRELLPRLSQFSLGPIAIVEQGRVAVGDEIGEFLRAQVAVVLIGERPGLSSPHSLGAYITWMPRRGRTDAERICISNIRPEGLGYDEAAMQMGQAVDSARRLRMTGVPVRAQIESARQGDGA